MHQCPTRSGVTGDWETRGISSPGLVSPAHPQKVRWTRVEARVLHLGSVQGAQPPRSQVDRALGPHHTRSGFSPAIPSLTGLVLALPQPVTSQFAKIPFTE